MARHTFSLLTRSVAVDPFTQGLTLHDIAEGIVIGSPVPVPPMNGDAFLLIAGFDWVFVSLVSRSSNETPEEPAGRITIVGPNDRPFDGPEFKLDLINGPSTRNFTKISNFPYVGDGEYRFQLQIQRADGWTVLGEHAVAVTVQHASVGEQRS